MKIIEKIKRKNENPTENPAVTLAFFGASNVEGCFDVFVNENGKIDTEVNVEEVFHSKVKGIFSMLYPHCPVNIINAGISGASSWGSIDRLHRDVISHKPDLCLVTFGNNDAFVDGGIHFDRYCESLKYIINELRANEIEVLFMTPTMNCTYVSRKIKDELLIDVAGQVADMQTSGRFTKFVNGARAVAKELNVPCADMYAIWEKLYENDVDVTSLLANRINHPIEKMHTLMAIEIVKTMFS